MQNEAKMLQNRFTKNMQVSVGLCIIGLIFSVFMALFSWGLTNIILPWTIDFWTVWASVVLATLIVSWIKFLRGDE